MTWFARSPRSAGAVLGARSFDLLTLTVLAVLVLHAAHSPWWLSAGLVVVLALRWWQRRREPVKAPLWLKLPLLGLLTLAILTTYGTIFGRGPGAALAVGLLVLKLLESESPRDVRVGTAFACFALMAALLFDQSLLATVGVGVGLLPALAALRSLEPGQAPTTLPRQLLPGLVLLVVSLPLTLFAFALVPRLGAPLWGAPQNDQARSGLSSEMSPGAMTDLLIDDSPAMRVAFDGPLPQRALLYFRGYVMWNYDGSSWHAADVAGDPADLAEPSDPVSYTITLLPTARRVMPALDVPLASVEGAQLQPGRTLVHARPVNDTLTYRLTSALHYRLQPRLERGLAASLQLPQGFNPRTLALGRQWRARHGDDTRAIVRAALDMFHDDGFSYTLAPAPLGRDRMDDFLFSTREGFCEYYASAFTVLMRAAGVPARVVTGYQGGFWNKLGNYLLVRQSDAHAWSEVWMAGRGWVRVDPTAAVRPERVNLGAAAAAGGDGRPWYQDAWLQGFRNRWDVVNRWWDKGVIGFDALRQRGLLTPFGVQQTDTQMLTLLLIIGSVLFATAGLTWAMLRRTAMDPALAGLRLLERKLGRAGVARRRGEGPQHYLTRAARAMPGQREALDALMQQYLALRYAGDPPARESLRAFRRAARDFHAPRVVQ
ncbi:DUF3488 and transglutaminase-like domain-containing protein [Dyella sp.]|jgi:transglutaminase-like putative cysteine protease|uniref:transglutaminase TgpA family protein n=1 Tax=Dyella sp. TaxID=1869338 RepID=UPI002D787AB1|nr:DUF3488 and transglutaminase-like domain-containing protein [Dyella sp.]HET6433920.1 DUF3488 and transglutaminase-like domain-containing protein [Dyella sp.]